MRNLTNSTDDVRDMVAEMDGCTALEVFSCDVPQGSAIGLLPHLAITIRTLIFDDDACGVDSAHDLLSDVAGRPTGLQVVWLGDTSRALYDDKFYCEDEKEKFAEILEVCGRAGIEVDREHKCTTVPPNAS